MADSQILTLYLQRSTQHLPAGILHPLNICFHGISLLFFNINPLELLAQTARVGVATAATAATAAAAAQHKAIKPDLKEAIRAGEAFRRQAEDLHEESDWRRPEAGGSHLKAEGVLLGPPPFHRPQMEVKHLRFPEDER